MKIGLVSDTHMPRHAKQLPQALREGLEGVDFIIHGGDWQTFAVVEELQRIAPVEGVIGNVDDEDIMNTFAAKRIFEYDDVHIGVVHGDRGKGRTTPERARNAFSDEAVDLIVFGHSHIPYDAILDGVSLFNPGSPTDKRRQPQFSYGILTIDEQMHLEHHYYNEKI